ncbi:hypothetical protein [Streptomyces adelaidensis]|uniref:hypothetical protein n=1 Tax=Streptomyces adelaidensis TaxID=2796465 RepID=UPI0019042802|nr:hypothetical protein [Streptomyces adelaidensis]
MPPRTPLSPRRSGYDWLLSCTDRPTAVQRAWRNEELAPFSTGPYWTVAQAPLGASVKAMRRIGAEGVGPVLADVEMDLAWWLLPADPGDDLDHVGQLTVHPPGWVLMCPPARYPLRPPSDRLWLEYPDGSGRLTDPVLLGAAFGLGAPSEASG